MLHVSLLWPSAFTLCEAGIAQADFAGSLLHLEIFLCHKLLILPFMLALKFLHSAIFSCVAREHSACLLTAGKTHPGGTDSEKRTPDWVGFHVLLLGSFHMQQVPL